MASNFTHPRPAGCGSKSAATGAARIGPRSRQAVVPASGAEGGVGAFARRAFGFGYHQHQSNVRSQMAEGLSVLASVAMADPAVLQDFEVIRRLGQSAPGDDEELYALLNQ